MPIDEIIAGAPGVRRRARAGWRAPRHTTIYAKPLDQGWRGKQSAGALSREHLSPREVATGRYPSLVWVFTRWHAGYLAFSRASFRDSQFCQSADALKNLPGIETALAAEPLPVPPLEAITPILAGDLMGEILRDGLPHFAAQDVVHRREGGTVA